MNYSMDDRDLSPVRSLVSLSGRITSVNAGEIKEKIHALVRQGKDELLFDLSGITFLDSSGLSVFVSVLRATREAGGWMKLAALSEIPGNIFRLTLLDRIIDLYPDVESALRAADS